jgi:tRNA pseudouridine55 synthase
MTGPAQQVSPPDAPPPLAGLLLIDKPARRPITSMVAVHEVRRRLVRGGLGEWKKLKVGHAGTLDPLASGLLVVLVGKATRLCEPLMAKTKVYVATIDLSRRSPTEDLERPTTPNDISVPPTLAQVHAALASFVGDIQQRPPDHSAVWVEGRRAYDLARRGHAPRTQPRAIRIDEMNLISYEFPLLSFEVRCGKGTYIRSLARDIGEALTGQPATLTALRRTYSAPFRVEDAIPMDDLPDAITRDQLLPVPSVRDEPGTNEPATNEPGTK